VTEVIQGVAELVKRFETLILYKMLVHVELKCSVVYHGKLNSETGRACVNVCARTCVRALSCYLFRLVQ
jgi:hypothetical protein